MGEVKVKSAVWRMSRSSTLWRYLITSVDCSSIYIVVYIEMSIKSVRWPTTGLLSVLLTVSGCCSFDRLPAGFLLCYVVLFLTHMSTRTSITNLQYTINMWLSAHKTSFTSLLMVCFASRNRGSWRQGFLMMSWCSLITCYNPTYSLVEPCYLSASPP